MKFKIALFFLAFLLLAFLAYSYIYKSHRDISSESVIAVTSAQLLSEFKLDETAANQKYLDKAIEVEGKITQVDTKEFFFVLDGKLFAVFQKKDFKVVNMSSPIVLKGRLIGYDNLLEEFKMDNCVIVE